MLETLLTEVKLKRFRKGRKSKPQFSIMDLNSHTLLSSKKRWILMDIGGKV